MSVTNAVTRSVIGTLAAAAFAAGMAVGPSAAQAAPTDATVLGPHYTWGLITGTIYFNKDETGSLAYAASLAGTAALAEEPFGLIITQRSLAVIAAAAQAELTGQCVKIKSNGTVGTYGGSDGDGYCQ